MFDEAAEKSVDRRNVLRKIGVGGATLIGGTVVGSGVGAASHHCQSGHQQKQAYGNGGDYYLVSDLSVENCDQGTKANDLTVNTSSGADSREAVDSIELQSRVVFNGHAVNLGIPPTYEETSQSVKNTTQSNSREATYGWDDLTADVKFFDNVVLKDRATFITGNHSETISNRIELSPRPVKRS